MKIRSWRAGAAALALAGCASTPGDAVLVSTSTATAVSTPSSIPTEETASAPEFEVHEWGLLDVDGTAAHAHSLPNPYVERRPVVVKKPVLYFHLATGTERATVDVKVTIPGDGGIVEHYPPGDVTDAGASVGWHVVLKKGTCGAGGPAKAEPTKDLPTCASADGICEVLELGNYVAADASCVEVPGGAGLNHLFYRAREKTPALPFDVTEEGGRVRIMHARGADVIGPIVYVHDDPVKPTVSVIAPPAMGASITADPPTTSDVTSAARAVDAAMREAGLTDEESAAFNRAWRSSLFGQDPAAKKAPPPGKEAVGPTDYLLFVVPMSLADGVAKLTITPPPRVVRRFLLVRLAI